MLRRALPLLAALALAACPEIRTSPPEIASPAPPPRCLSIVAWNDLHGQLGPDNPTVDTGSLAAGGVVALADQIADVRATGDTVVLLDAGDLFTGPMASTMAEGEPVIEAYRLLGVDAAAIGNHEFDFGPVGYERVTAKPGAGDEAGPDGPRGALLARMAAASFPFLSANLHRKDGGELYWRNQRAWARIARDGYDVGVVGYTTRDTPTTTLAANVSDLDFSTNAGARVASAVRELRAVGAAPVVLLAHASLEGELPERLDDGASHSGELASLIGGLGADLPDVVVAGHRHAWMLGRVRGVPVVSSDQHGVGLARIRYCREGRGLRLEGVERRVAVAAAPPRSALGAQVEAAMAPWEARVKPIAEAPVAKIPFQCNHRSVFPSALFDQVARATAERVADAAPAPPGVPVVGLINAGSLRASLVPGQARYGDLFKVLPFENTVSVCGTTRRGLVRLIENAFRKDSSRERFPLGISGAKLRVSRDPSFHPTLVALTIDGEAKDAGDDAPVWLALSDFVLGGGDGLLFGVRCAPAATSQMRIRDAWRELLQRENGECAAASSNIKNE